MAQKAEVEIELLSYDGDIVVGREYVEFNRKILTTSQIITSLVYGMDSLLRNKRFKKLLSDIYVWETHPTYSIVDDQRILREAKEQRTLITTIPKAVLQEAISKTLRRYQQKERELNGN